jgi:hypothetical protein
VVGLGSAGPARFARLTGGFGDDHLYGGGPTAEFDAGAGDDLLAIRDGVQNSGTCGAGTDVGLLDNSNDPNRGPTDVATECESVPEFQPVPSSLRVALADAGQTIGSNGAAGVDVTTPRAGPVVIEQVGQADPVPGSAVLPVQMDIRAPESRAGESLSLRFLFANWIVPSGGDLDRIEVRRDGVAVPDCAGGSDPDPCVARRSRDDISPYDHNPYDPEADFYASIVVRSSAGGRWTFGVPSGFSPIAIADPAAPRPADPGTPADETAPRLRIVGLRAPRLKALVKQGIRVPLVCSERCESTTQLVLGRATAKRLRLPTVIGRYRTSLDGRKVVRVKLSRAAARKLRRTRTLALTVRAGATDRAGNRARTVSNKLRVR